MQNAGIKGDEVKKFMDIKTAFQKITKRGNSRNGLKTLKASDSPEEFFDEQKSTFLNMWKKTRDIIVKMQHRSQRLTRLESEMRRLTPFSQQITRKEKSFYWPLKGKWAHRYKMWMLIHCLFIGVFQAIRVAFEEKPAYYVIFIEIYLDLVFAVDMARIFSTPLVK